MGRLAVLGLFSTIARAGAVAAAMVLAAVPAWAGPYSDIIVFGDSVVDAGNAQELSGSNRAHLGYYNGRYSDGPVYTDVLYRALFGTDMTASLLGGTNYAYGGARVKGGSVPDLVSQIDAFEAAVGGSAAADALYVINITGNDMLALMSGSTDGLSKEDYAARAGATLRAQLERLTALGARHILMTDVPNPAMPTQLPDGVLLQNAIDAALEGLTLEADLMTFSFASFYQRLLIDPTSVGLPADLRRDLHCLAVETPAPNVDCSGYFFFDSGHGTAVTHAATAREVAQIVGITLVPEPAALGLVGLGVIVIGATARRRSLRG